MTMKEEIPYTALDKNGLTIGTGTIELNPITIVAEHAHLHPNRLKAPITKITITGNGNTITKKDLQSIAELWEETTDDQEGNVYVIYHRLAKH
jgi:hypothetical protein